MKPYAASARSYPDSCQSRAGFLTIADGRGMIHVFIQRHIPAAHPSGRSQTGRPPISMSYKHIDDFYYVTSEVLCELYAAFPVRHMLLVEDLIGPIKWDMTGMPDRRSRACFETLIWLSDHDLLTFRTVEPRDIGIEGAVLTQKAFVLLTGLVAWEEGEAISRIDALRDARVRRAYADLGTIIKDVFRANCQWGAPSEPAPLIRSESLAVSSDGD
jgi:hypothetical protein